jgi:uncharacterized protein YlxW (UPF0749 family)
MLMTVGVVLGFVAVLAMQLQPPDPESRLPEQYRLAALIDRQTEDNENQRREVEQLRQDLEELRTQALSQRDDLQDQNGDISQLGTRVGLTEVAGPGFVATLDDSSLEASPTGNLNDLVIHSQDIQGVVNGMWSSGAEAISINGQRVIATSAVLCVGNTLLINGTVHSPPYEVTAVGANRNAFMSEPLVTRFQQVADRYSLGFSVTPVGPQVVPAYSGAITPQYAEPVEAS